MANIVIVPSNPSPPLGLHDDSGYDHWYDYWLWHCEDPLLTLEEIGDSTVLRKFLSFAEFKDALNLFYHGKILIQRQSAAWRIMACDPTELPIKTWFENNQDLHEITTSADATTVSAWIEDNLHGGCNVFNTAWGDRVINLPLTIRCRSDRDATLLKLKFG